MRSNGLNFLLFFLLIIFSTLKSEVKETNGSEQPEVLLEIFGNPAQAELFIGKVNSEVEQIFIDRNQIMLYQNRFIFGFSRDADSDHLITFVLKNGSIYDHQVYISQKQYKISEINTLPKKYTTTTPDKKILARIRNERSIRDSIFKEINSNHRLYAQNFSPPLPLTRISTPFGAQRIFNGKPRSPHYGLDIAIGLGTTVQTMGSGIVVLARNFFYSGKYIIIDHGLGLSSHYMHLAKIIIKEGDIVRKGDIIGAVGSTGRSTGPHLHWGLRWQNSYLDPISALELSESFLVIRKEN